MDEKQNAEVADVQPEFSGYVPKPIQLELRRAWRLIHKEGKYDEGMSIIIDLSGMPNCRIKDRFIEGT